MQWMTNNVNPHPPKKGFLSNSGGDDVLSMRGHKDSFIFFLKIKVGCSSIDIK